MKLTGDEYAEVMNLYSLYNLSTDRGTPEEYASCFTLTGALKLPQGVSYQGREALTEYKRSDRARLHDQYRMHWNGSVHLQKLDAQTIRGRCYLQVFKGNPGREPIVTAMAVYEDQIVRQNGDWKFATRELFFDFRQRT